MPTVATAKTCLVTGGTGFIGSHLVRRLVADGWRVHVLARAQSSFWRIEDIAERVQIHRVEKDDYVSGLGRRGWVDAVFHLATAYGRGGEPASDVVQTNLCFPLRLLEWAIAGGVPLYVSTDTCFPIDYPYLRGYTVSKKQFASWAGMLAEETATKCVNLVLQHPYGPDDSPGKFVPWLIDQCQRNIASIDLTAGDQQKDFIFIDDVVDAYTAIAGAVDRLPDGFVALQCGSGQAISVRRFVELVHRLCGSRSRLNFGALPDRPGEVRKSVADVAPLRNLGWRPETALEQGLRRTIPGAMGTADRGSHGHA